METPKITPLNHIGELGNIGRFHVLDPFGGLGLEALVAKLLGTAQSFKTVGTAQANMEPHKGACNNYASLGKIGLQGVLPCILVGLWELGGVMAQKKSCVREGRGRMSHCWGPGRTKLEKEFQPARSKSAV